jgi:hypothetical protein
MFRISRATIIIVCLTFASVVATVSEPEPLTRKKHANLSIILNGLAQTCAQVGQLLTEDNQEAKQLGILTVISTALATVAQLTEHHTNTKAPDYVPASSNLATLSTLLFEEVDQEQLIILPHTSPLLAQLMRLHIDERETLTRSFITSPDKKSQFLDELFALLTSYLMKKIPLITERIKQHLLHRLSTPLQG